MRSTLISLHEADESKHNFHVIYVSHTDHILVWLYKTIYYICFSFFLRLAGSKLFDQFRALFVEL